MNEQIWQTFKVVSERQSISGAARFLNLSQSAVSQHIRQLEEEYHAPLFFRTSRGVVLTDTGELVYRHVTNLLGILEESRQQVSEQLGRVPSKLAVGASLTIAEYVLPHALCRMQDIPAGMTVYMANSHDVVDRVVNHDLDVGLIEAPVVSPHVLVRPFLEDHLSIVVGPHHPWAERSAITLEEFIGAPLLLREPGSGTRMVLEDALNQVGIAISQLNVRFVLATTQAIKTMIALDMGLSVLSPLTILPHERTQFHLLTLDGLPLPRTLSLVYYQDLAHPAAKTLIRTISTLPWNSLLHKEPQN